MPTNKANTTMFSWFVFPCSIVFVWYDRFLSSWIYEAGNEPNTSLKQTASLWVTVEHTLSNHVTVMTSALYQPLSRVHKLTHMSAGLKGKALFQCNCMWHENGNRVIQFWCVHSCIWFKFCTVPFSVFLIPPTTPRTLCCSCHMMPVMLFGFLWSAVWPAA